MKGRWPNQDGSSGWSGREGCFRGLSLEMWRLEVGEGGSVRAPRLAGETWYWAA